MAFVSMDREHPTQITYVDVYDGPSSLQKRDQLPTQKERENGGPLNFETEREKHILRLRDAIPDMQDASQRL